MIMHMFSTTAICVCFTAQTAFHKQAKLKLCGVHSKTNCKNRTPTSKPASEAESSIIETPSPARSRSPLLFETLPTLARQRAQGKNTYTDSTFFLVHTSGGRPQVECENTQCLVSIARSV